MIKFKVNGRTVNIPTNWDEPTFEQYYKILRSSENDDSLVRALAALCDVEYEVFRKAELKGFENVMVALTFLNTPPDWGNPRPKAVGAFALPEDITMDSVAQFEDMKSIYDSHKDKPISELVDQMPLIIAIYLQKYTMGTYDYSEAQQLAPKLRQYPAREVVEAANFFIAKLLTMTLGTPTSFHPPMLTRLRWALSKFLKRLGF
jgi:hypothetical protein